MNVFDSEMTEGPRRDGFWFRAAELGARLGAARIGAGLYEARPGVPIWPYHYHYPDEEWLYVLDGAPVLRDLSGRRVLEAGDIVCFPPGHRGAHTLEGPGRFVLFSGERSSGPFVSVYPDSDKVSVFPGIEADRLNALRLVRAGSVDYWYGEGNGPVEPRRVGERLDAAVLELDPGADPGPYRYEYGRELWLLVIAGAPTLQHAEGERTLSPGDLACLPEGPAGGRSVLNRSGDTARLLLLWTTGLPAAACYPETGEWVLRTDRGADEIRLRRA